jgi:hypothetical protein
MRANSSSNRKTIRLLSPSTLLVVAALLTSRLGCAPVPAKDGSRENDDDYTTLTTPLPRVGFDRPDDSGQPSVKVLYVVPTWAKDRQRDTNGEIARHIFAQNEWIASQNGGFGVRLDTYNGALDIGYVSLDVTRDEWASWFDQDLGPAADELRRLGWPVGRIPSDNGGDLYYVVWEAFAGNYKRTGAGTGTCRPTIDGQNSRNRMVGIATARLDGSPCPLTTQRFPFHAGPTTQRDWFRSSAPFVDHSLQSMRALPDCGLTESPRDGELVVIPGTNGSTEIRGGFIRDLLPPTDPLAYRWSEADPMSRPGLDPDHWVYFHVTNDKLARTSCNSDASRHPMWDDKPFDRQGYRTLLRSSYDRPDDISGPQVHVVYAVKNGTPDRQFDTNGLIERSIEHMDRWLFEESGGTGIRFDTYQGRLDVTYFPIPVGITTTEGRSCSGPPCPSEIDLVNHFKATGKYVEGKQYLFFYDGGIVFNRGSGGLCGGSVKGPSSFVNLDHAIGPMCQYIPWFSADTTKWSIGLLMLHELFHALGAVCNSTTGHSPDPTDLMYASAGDGSKLDLGRNDYWGNTDGRCDDLSKSPLFTKKSAPFDSPFPG